MENPFTYKLFILINHFGIRRVSIIAQSCTIQPRYLIDSITKSNLRSGEENRGLPVVGEIINPARSPQYAKNNHFDEQHLISDIRYPKIIQTEKSHTGEGTFTAGNSEEAKQIVSKYPGQKFKIAPFIEGDPWTINGCVVGDKVYVAGLSYQITGIPELNRLPKCYCGQ